MSIIGFEAPKIKLPSKADVFGHPGKPIGICEKCRKMFPTNELQKYQPSPNESVSFWLCPRCAFKKRMREKFSGKL